MYSIRIGVRTDWICSTSLGIAAGSPVAEATAGMKPAMSVMWPSRSSRHTTSTRIPVAMSSAESTKTACSIGVSAPSRVIIAQANGWVNGCCARGSPFHVQVVTVPTVPTATSSDSGAAVIGSYSKGGHITVPSDRRTP